MVSIFTVTCASNKKAAEPEKPTGPQRTGDEKDGIYVGIITFGPDAEDITGGPIYLDEEGLAQLEYLIDNEYQVEENIGTALYYAAHLGLANMKKIEHKLPYYLQNVIMITFTDGLDVSSTGLSLEPIEDPGNPGNIKFAGSDIRLYQNFIKMEIDSRLINNTNVEAYIVAVPGDDVTDLSYFNETRRALSTSGAKYGGTNDIGMNELQGVFQEIARSIVLDWTETTFTMITPQYARGTRIRMTFAGESTSLRAQNARLYLEGEVIIRDNEYYLTNIRYNGGIYSTAGYEIKGRIDSGRVVYEFPFFTGYDFTKPQAVRENELRMWRMNARETEWQVNSEYQLGSEADHVVTKYNALIYLIIDKSSSIKEDDVPKIQDAAKSFINMLYDAYNRE